MILAATERRVRATLQGIGRSENNSLQFLNVFIRDICSGKQQKYIRIKVKAVSELQ